jgi:hypothetical protein
MVKKQPEPVTRDHILNLLSEDEAKSVRSTEPAAQLAIGDEFIDLAQLAMGVQRAEESHPTEDVISRKAINEHTWQKVVTNLNARQLMTYTRPVTRRRP